ncbi:hypothetical protein LSH36_47g00002 [Paralvinella palmiformis]|uniref:Amine oxidase n=1 Tax=Paralvinella palmiformis TaxID=53620 RepID=A0AAD9NCV5_9ANNE|nr:hypothetical protein LSH36_47g00002 [Paralvinella palmiformis]
MTSYARLVSTVILLVYQVTLIECQLKHKRKDAKYLIIGAGIAGLAAAKNLVDHNETDFLILEAHSKIGGRIRSEVVDGITLELGCQWINSYSSPIGQLANRVNLDMRDEPGNDLQYRDTNGANITGLALARYNQYDSAYKYTANLANQLIYDNKRKPDISLRSALALGGWRPRDSLDYAIEYPDMDFDYGQEPEVTSLRHSPAPWFNDDSSYEELIVIDQDGGLFQIARQLLDDVMGNDDRRLKLNHLITEILYADDGVRVTTSDKRSYTADYVIITVSLGVLQNEVITFDPPLPGWKRYSLMAATLVTDYPIYVVFPKDQKPFWEDFDITLHVHDRRGYYPLWQNYDKFINKSRVLQAQLSGSEAKRIARLNDEEIKSEIRSVLSNMYNVTIPEMKVVVPRWDTDPLFYGSYTDWSPSFSDSSFDALQASVGRLYFAGEAYHRLYFGYMEGAYASAMDQTNKLLQCVSDSSKCKHYVPPYESQGCTYEAAKNYDEEAQMDDGTCQFEKTPINGCLSRWPQMTLLLYLGILVSGF